VRKLFFSLTPFLFSIELADLNILHASHSFPLSPNGTSSSSSSQFTVTAAKAGSILLQGDGTAQFNNSVGTNNSFQVGSNTNLGVNASASSSLPYGVSSIATLDIGASSVLKQVIGTSATNVAKSTTATAAHEVARGAMASTEIGVEWDRNTNGRWSSEGAWKVDYDREYNSAYSNAYSNIKSNETSTGQSGTISGVFKTKETGSATTGGSMADWSLAASAVAEAKYGSSYEYSHNFASESEYRAAFDAEYNRAYAEAAARAQRTSESEVTVNGIGSDASVIPAETSKFDVQIAVADESTAVNPVGNANGSAGLNLTTSSFANQSNASTASGFIQAFGGTKINPIPSIIPHCGAGGAGVCWDRTTETDFDEIEIFSSPPTTDSEGDEYLGSIFGFDDSNMPISGESIQNPYY